VAGADGEKQGPEADPVGQPGVGLFQAPRLVPLVRPVALSVLEAGGSRHRLGRAHGFDDAVADPFEPGRVMPEQRLPESVV